MHVNIFVFFFFFEKKVKKAKAKKNLSLASRLETNRPTYSLDHLVKERYFLLFYDQNFDICEL